MGGALSRAAGGEVDVEQFDDHRWAPEAHAVLAHVAEGHRVAGGRSGELGHGHVVRRSGAKVAADADRTFNRVSSTK
jgi:hypothetical protein